MLAARLLGWLCGLPKQYTLALDALLVFGSLLPGKAVVDAPRKLEVS